MNTTNRYSDIIKKRYPEMKDLQQHGQNVNGLKFKKVAGNNNGKYLKMWKRLKLWERLMLCKTTGF